MKLITAQQIAEQVSVPAMIEAMYQGHRFERASAERSVMDGPGGQQLLISPAWQQERALGLKLATVFPGNSALNLPREHGLYLLFSPETGQPAAVIDAAALTPLKTAADSALAARFLAPENATTLLMVGAGMIAAALIRAHLTVMPGLQRVLIWNRHQQKAQQLADQLASVGQGPQVEVVSDLELATRQSQLISCATPSEEPLIRGDWVQPGSHVDLVGGYTPQMRESDSDLVAKASLFVDSREFTLEHCGDLCIPLQEQRIDRADIRADLFQLCRNQVRGRRRADEITLFKNAGGPHLDLMAAQLIAEQIGD